MQLCQKRSPHQATTHVISAGKYSSSDINLLFIGVITAKVSHSRVKFAVQHLQIQSNYHDMENAILLEIQTKGTPKGWRRISPMLAQLATKLSLGKNI